MRQIVAKAMDMSGDYLPADAELSDDDERLFERGIEACAKHLADLQRAYGEPQKRPRTRLSRATGPGRMRRRCPSIMLAGRSWFSVRSYKPSHDHTSMISMT